MYEIHARQLAYKLANEYYGRDFNELTPEMQNDLMQQGYEGAENAIEVTMRNLTQAGIEKMGG